MPRSVGHSALVTVHLLAGVTSALTALGCNTSGARLLPGQILEKISSTQLTATRFTTFRFEGPVQRPAMSEYPVVMWPDEGWKARTWSEPATPSELSALIGFLTEERDKYARSGKYGDEVRRIEAMIADLSEWPADSCLFSYLYKEKPGSDFRHGDWLFFFYLDGRAGTVTEITNAFR